MNVRLEDRAGGLVEMVFDRPGVNVFDQQTLSDLDHCVSELEGREGVKGLILTSAHKSVFIAGADLHSLSGEGDPEKLKDMAQAGQQIFHRLAQLPMTKVAAIHGACLGGGYECTLACDYRLATPHKSTRIGLPETSLGILPAWGGCTLLPRLIGVPKALDVILNGRRLPAVPAKKRGMIDAVIPEERLMDHAKIWAAKRCRKPRARGLMDTRLAMAVIRMKASAALQAKTGGHYPAPEKALGLLVRTLFMKREESFRAEAMYFSQLAVSETSRNLVRLFFMQEAAKKKRVDDSRPEPVSRAAVIGAGVMGSGIAQWCAARGMRVVLKDIAAEGVAKGMQTVRNVTQAAVKRRILTRAEGQAVVDRVLPTHQDLPMHSAEVVIEAIVEKMAVKKTLFEDLARCTGPQTLLASNTSALSVTEMAQAAPDPGQVCGIHFFNPVHRMALVEVVQAKHTRPEVLQRAVSFVQQLGKTPVVVQDKPGFVVNRVLMPYLIEAGRLYEENFGAPELDRAMLAFGMPMGPMRLMDEIGIDICHHVAEFLCKELSYLPEMPGILSQLIELGRLGKKSSAGFYDYHHRRKPVAQQRGNLEASPLSAEDLRDRMVLPMINEAARILEEGVAASPEDVDLAMVLGTGFAPFSGGPLRYADARGLQAIAARMECLAESGGAHFAPCAYLVEKCKSGDNFYLESEA